MLLCMWVSACQWLCPSACPYARVPPAPSHPCACVQVSDSTTLLNQTVGESLQQLDGEYAKQADYVAIVQKLQAQLDELVRQEAEVPFWRNADVSLEDLASRAELYDWYR